ncbi:hypothetical protein HYPSUDRAFT_41040 [Hypholoma sublateritium FD-334 SS-4]|uniref:Uncharacterized protein n=1 Tax=Hypholoma sublateritium (strain FD-334 SS-4) TaxID=945553 RepID=A0A0D2MFP9_HYPSF|nr:hypothetical protein HYPSUDRAFT_41040 [Hypholoma sublateritium FD-334 SS-4]
MSSPPAIVVYSPSSSFARPRRRLHHRGLHPPAAVSPAGRRPPPPCPPLPPPSFARRRPTSSFSYRRYNPHHCPHSRPPASSHSLAGALFSLAPCARRPPSLAAVSLARRRRSPTPLLPRLSSCAVVAHPLPPLPAVSNCMLPMPSAPLPPPNIPRRPSHQPLPLASAVTRLHPPVACA